MPMKRFTKVSLLVASAVFVATQVGLVWGLGAVSDLKQIYSFRAGPPPCVVPTTPDGNLNLSVRMDCGAVTNIMTKPGGFAALLDGGDGGACDDTTTTIQANKAAAALCLAADAALAGSGGCFFSAAAGPLGFCPALPAPGGPVDAGDPITGPADCVAALAAGGVQCPIPPVVGNGFMIDTDGSFRFNVERCGACTIKNFEADRDDGGPLWDDPANLLIRLDPESAPRPFNVTGDALGAPGPGPSSFTVTVDSVAGGANPTTDEEIHTALCAAFANAGVMALPHPPADIGLFVDPPSTGFFFELRPTSIVTEMGVRPQATGSTEATQPDLTMQQVAVPQSVSASTNPTPTLNEWGMGILIAILLITGIWMLRRRQRLQNV